MISETYSHEDKSGAGENVKRDRIAKQTGQDIGLQ